MAGTVLGRHVTQKSNQVVSEAKVIADGWEGPHGGGPNGVPEDRIAQSSIARMHSHFARTPSATMALNARKRALCRKLRPAGEEHAHTRRQTHDAGTKCRTSKRGACGTRGDGREAAGANHAMPAPPGLHRGRRPLGARPRAYVEMGAARAKAAAAAARHASGRRAWPDG